MIDVITELQALAQTGLSYSKDQFDLERFKRVLEISALLMANNSTHAYEQVIEVFSLDTGYATPKIDVRGAVFKDNQILLVQEQTDSNWAMPGGWADVNLSPVENVLKELREESGYHCNMIKLVGVFDKRKLDTNMMWPHLYKMFFLCDIVSYEKTSSIEILDVGFFDLDKLPPLSLGRVNEQQIQLCFEHFNNRALPTFCD
jgi:ADP-ribose pyrophosphatase YjhB (NUDIX family)